VAMGPCRQVATDGNATLEISLKPERPERLNDPHSLGKPSTWCIYVYFDIGQLETYLRRVIVMHQETYEKLFATCTSWKIEKLKSCARVKNHSEIFI
jgi:hypothetical protein